jgi:hypothetical protein
MANTVQDAYRIVFNDMMNSGCGLLVGKYNAKNSNEKYMFGVDTVMEWIAYKVSEAQGDDFSELFTKNMVESQKKARGDK